jgi:hypothetical protein
VADAICPFAHLSTTNDAGLARQVNGRAAAPALVKLWPGQVGAPEITTTEAEKAQRAEIDEYIRLSKELCQATEGSEEFTEAYGIKRRIYGGANEAQDLEIPGSPIETRFGAQSLEGQERGDLHRRNARKKSAATSCVTAAW